MRHRMRIGAEEGFSMVEVMIAAVLLLFIALGLVPLFGRSISNNAAASDFSQATNGNRSRLEEALQSPFNSQIMDVPTGELSVEVHDFWAQGGRGTIGDASEGWWPPIDPEGVTPPSDKGTILWDRRVVTQQYSMNSFSKTDLVLTPNEREPGGTDRIYVHLKEVEVILESEKDSGIFGGGRRVAFRVYKPF